MNIFANFKIMLKVGIAFGLILLLQATSGLLGLQKMSAMHDAGRDITENWLPSIRALDELDKQVLELRRSELAHILAEDSQEIAEMDRRIVENRNTLEKARLTYEGMISLPEEKKNYQIFLAKYRDYQVVQDRVLVASRQNDNATAFTLVKKEALPLFNDMRALLVKSIELNNQGSLQAAQVQTNSYENARTSTLTLLAVTFALTIGLALVFRSTIATPVVSMTSAMRSLANGDKSISIPSVGRGDEIGAMADAVQVFKDNAIRADKLAAEQAAEQAERQRRAETIEKLTSNFDRDVARILDTVAGAATEMEATAQAMSANAEQTNRQAATVSAASDEAASSVQTVASAAEELSASIQEIGRQVEQASRASQAASEEANRTNQTVKGLAETSNRIGEVINLINDIASQTNLLALNATIEAARAGEAGKGFAVVAGEVKNLANQTARATEEIGNQIAAVQSATQEAVGAIGGIVNRISEIHQVATAIAASVEEQSAATAEIARNVQHASTGTQHVSSNIEGVTHAASETGEAAEQVLGASRSLAQEATSLKDMVTHFLSDVRKA